MSAAIAGLPNGVTLNALAKRVFDVLSGYTAFPWAIMKAQSGRAGVDASQLSPADLNAMLPFLVEGVGRFTSPAKGKAVEAELTAMFRH